MVYFGFDSPTTVKWSAFRWRFAWFVRRRSSHRPTVDRWRVIIWLARSPIALWWILAVKFISTSSTERLILWRYFLLIRLGANFGLASCLQTRISQVPQALHAIRQRSLPKSADPFLKTTSFLRPTWKFNVGQVKMWILCYYICVIVSRSPFRFFPVFFGADDPRRVLLAILFPHLKTPLLFSSLFLHVKRTCVHIYISLHLHLDIFRKKNSWAD